MNIHNICIFILLLLGLTGCAGGCYTPFLATGDPSFTYDTELCHMVRGEPFDHSSLVSSEEIKVKNSVGNTIRTYQIRRHNNGNVDINVRD